MPADEFQTGQLVATRYRLGKVLGRGGMALVYKAWDTRLNRDVAIKFIRPALASDPAMLRRFSREAQSAGGLSHPNIVAIYDTGTSQLPDDDTNLEIPFIVMELIEGQTIQELMTARRIDAGITPTQDPSRNTPSGRDSEVPRKAEVDTQEDLGDSTNREATDTQDQDTSKNFDSKDSSQGSDATGADGPNPEQTEAKPPDSDSEEIADDETTGVSSDSESSTDVEKSTSGDATPTHTPQRRPSAAMPIAEAIDIACEVLGALHYSHERGIVHRDIKPGNIMVNERGDVKVMDFGIARAMSDTAATQTQHPVGTAHYISPEQAQASPVDHRTDIYSAACLLYELLTGTTPFKGDTPYAITYQHVQKTPDVPSVLSPEISPALDRVVTKAMAKSADDRFQSADSFLQELTKAITNPDADHGDDESEADASPNVIFLRPDVEASPAEKETPGTDTAEIEETAPRKRWLAFSLLGAAAFLVLGLLLWSVQQMVIDSGQNADPLRVGVPSILQLDNTTAQEQVEAAGLIYRQVSEEFSDSPEGTVLNTSPVAGFEVERGSVISVTVSKGPEKKSIPSVLGYAKDAAQTTLIDAGFVIDKIEKVDDPDRPAGSVVSVEPEMGSTHPTGTKVIVRICSGYIDLPDVAGQTLAEAQSTLKNLKLETLVSEEYSSSHDPGKVIRQLPAPRRVRQQSTIALVVAKKPAPRPVVRAPKETPKQTATATPSTTTTKPPANRVTPTASPKPPNDNGQPTETLD